jgi:hypothetical protein
MKHLIRNSMAICVGLCALTSVSAAFAVGTGTTFGVNENAVPGSFPHPFQANSNDLSYHACSDVIPPAAGVQQRMAESGFFWLSSYQDANSVVDSQINDFQPNGYHIYGVYRFTSELVAKGSSPLGNRRGYEMKDASLTLFLDPNKDTVIGAGGGCIIGFTNTADDVRIGEATHLSEGEKSEKDGLANGDFQMVLDDWTWFNPAPYVPFAPFSTITLNANVTSLGGPLDNDHNPEGSGNIFWKD